MNNPTVILLRAGRVVSTPLRAKGTKVYRKVAPMPFRLDDQRDIPVIGGHHTQAVSCLIVYVASLCQDIRILDTKQNRKKLKENDYIWFESKCSYNKLHRRIL